MRKALMTAVLLLITGVTVSAQEAQRTPPGGDMVGSDRSLQRGDIRTSPSPSPDQNQRMTNSAGTSSGYEKVPAYSGASTEQRTLGRASGRRRTHGATVAKSKGARSDAAGKKSKAPTKRKKPHKSPPR